MIVSINGQKIDTNDILFVSQSYEDDRITGKKEL